MHSRLIHNWKIVSYFTFCIIPLNLWATYYYFWEFFHTFLSFYLHLRFWPFIIITLIQWSSIWDTDILHNLNVARLTQLNKMTYLFLEIYVIETSVFRPISDVMNYLHFYDAWITYIFKPYTKINIITITFWT